MDVCAESGCDKTPQWLVPLDTSNMPGVVIGVRYFCDEHKPPKGTVLQP